MQATNPVGRGNAARRGEAGFTLVEALVAIVVLVFGLMAVTNLMLVAASSNSVANQGTAAVTSSTRIIELMKATSFANLSPPPGTGGAIAFEEPIVRGPDCATAVVSDYHCTDDIPGVGAIHTHWQVTQTTDPRLVFIQVRAEGTGALSATRSRSEFTTFRACTNSSAPPAGSCPTP
jgi:type II secretory pathway pseudopilin PulG